MGIEPIVEGLPPPLDLKSRSATRPLATPMFFIRNRAIRQTLLPGLMPLMPILLVEVKKVKLSFSHNQLFTFLRFSVIFTKANFANALGHRYRHPRTRIAKREAGWPRRSGPLRTVFFFAIIHNRWACSSVGRALGSHSRGQGFESPHVHQAKLSPNTGAWLRGRALDSHSRGPEFKSLRPHHLKPYPGKAFCFAQVRCRAGICFSAESLVHF